MAFRGLPSDQYVTVESLIDGIMARGRGTLLAKFDVVSAYRNVAIHPLPWITHF